MAGIVVLACWIGFYLYWSLAAGGGKAVAERQSRGSEIGHRLPLLIAAALLIFPTPFWGLDTPLLAETTMQRNVAAAITMCGLAIAVWARATLGGNWSGAVTLKQDHELVRRGPYCLVRNPIYTGLLVMFIGTALLIGEVRGALGFVFAVVALWIKLKQEERFMLRQFPDTYPAYRKQVKALIPFIL